MREGARVKIVSPPLEGWLATVVRVSFSDGSAWVRTDKPLPENLRTFSDERKDNIRVQPGDVEVIR